MRCVVVCALLALAACSSGPNNRFTEHQKKITPPPPKEALKKVVKQEVDYHGLVAEGALPGVVQHHVGPRPPRGADRRRRRGRP